MVVLDAAQLQPQIDFETDATLATTRYQNGKLTFVDWSGTLLRLNEWGRWEQVGTTGKDEVSAYVFSQDNRVEEPVDPSQGRS